MMMLKKYVKGANVENQNDPEKLNIGPAAPQDHHDGVSDQPPSTAQSVANSQRASEWNSHIGDIKHTLIVNFLFQQQCSHLWVGDGSGEMEGVCLRKDHYEYICCPPQLVNSAFYEGCKELNAQVGSAQVVQERK
jgi:hypothetical protein